MENNKIQYVCSKCGCTHYVSDEINVTGSGLSKMFDIQNRGFIVVSCARCGYSELYKRKTSLGMNILDFLIGN